MSVVVDIIPGALGGGGATGLAGVLPGSGASDLGLGVGGGGYGSGLSNAAFGSGQLGAQNSYIGNSGGMYVRNIMGVLYLLVINILINCVLTGGLFCTSKSVLKGFN